jgi:VanZ family protein
MKPATAARLRLLSATVLACYWLAMFLGTHWPNFKLEQFPQNTDKVLHVSAYAGLSFLIAVWLILKRANVPAGSAGFPNLSLRDGLWIMAVIVGYSVFDEVSQIPVGRTCDFFDALADWIGALIGLSAFTVLQLALRRWVIARNS